MEERSENWVIHNLYRLYYLRTKPAADAIKFTLDVETILKTVGDINTRSMTQVKEQKDEAKKEDLNFKEFL